MLSPRVPIEATALHHNGAVTFQALTPGVLPERRHCTRPVQITVINGACQWGVHQIGDTFAVDRTTPKGMCLGAWNAVAPYVTALLCGDVDWSPEKGVMTLHCADPEGITQELRRVGR